MSLTNSGSLMSRTVSPQQGIGKYRQPPSVQAVARRLGVTPAVAEQLTKLSDERNPFVKAAEIIAALLEEGHEQFADRLMLPVDLARSIATPPAWTKELRKQAHYVDVMEGINEKA